MTVTRAGLAGADDFIQFGKDLGAILHAEIAAAQTIDIVDGLGTDIQIVQRAAHLGAERAAGIGERFGLVQNGQGLEVAKGLASSSSGKGRNTRSLKHADLFALRAQFIDAGAGGTRRRADEQHSGFGVLQAVGFKEP